MFFRSWINRYLKNISFDLILYALNGEPFIFLLPIFFAAQIIGGAKELAVLL